MVRIHERWVPVLAFTVVVGCGGAEGSGEETGSGSSAGPDGDDGGSSGPTQTGSGADGGDGGETSGAGTSGDTGGTSATGTSGPPPGSAGCGTLNPPSGMLTIDIQGMGADYVVSVPSTYDPNRPYPLGFAFHGRNRTGPNCQQGDCAGFQDAMEDEAVLIYMTSLGGTGWEGMGERELNVEFFEAVLAQLTAGYCVDESKIFVAGTSSGAHFANVLGCRFGDVLAAISPVAGYLPERDNCVGRAAALVIHGVDDSSFDSGVEARDFWRMQNGCSDQTVPPIDEVHDSVVANRETHGCAVYQGCDPGLPVVWCEHSEGGYDGSTHGWPLFGGQEIWDFVSAL